MDFKLQANEKDLLEMIRLECRQSNPIIKKMLNQILEQEEARTFVLKQDNYFIDEIARESPPLFLQLLNCEYSYNWIRKQVEETVSDEKPLFVEMPFVKWTTEVLSQSHRNSFKNKVAKQYYQEFLDIKEIIVGHLSKLCEEKSDLMKKFFKHSIEFKEKETTIIEAWINLFDTNSEIILSQEFIDIYKSKNDRMPAFEMLDWSYKLVKHITEEEYFSENLLENKTVLARTLLKRFHTFSQLRNMSLIIPHLDEFFETHEKELRENIGFVNVLTQKNFNPDVKYLSYYDEYLTAISNLNSFKSNLPAQKEMNNIIDFLSDQKNEWAKLAMKVKFSTELKENEIKEIKIKKI